MVPGRAGSRKAQSGVGWAILTGVGRALGVCAAVGLLCEQGEVGRARKGERETSVSEKELLFLSYESLESGSRL